MIPQPLALVLQYSDGFKDKLSASVEEGKLEVFTLRSGTIQSVSLHGWDRYSRSIRFGPQYVAVGSGISLQTKTL